MMEMINKYMTDCIIESTVVLISMSDKETADKFLQKALELLQTQDAKDMLLKISSMVRSPEPETVDTSNYTREQKGEFDWNEKIARKYIEIAEKLRSKRDKMDAEFLKIAAEFVPPQDMKDLLLKIQLIAHAPESENIDEPTYTSEPKKEERSKRKNIVAKCIEAAELFITMQDRQSAVDLLQKTDKIFPSQKIKDLLLKISLMAPAPQREKINIPKYTRVEMEELIRNFDIVAIAIAVAEVLITMRDWDGALQLLQKTDEYLPSQKVKDLILKISLMAPATQGKKVNVPKCTGEQKEALVKNDAIAGKSSK